MHSSLQLAPLPVFDAASESSTGLDTKSRAMKEKANWRNSAPCEALGVSGATPARKLVSLHPMAIEVGCFSG